jgi:hypothetical protein
MMDGVCLSPSATIKSASSCGTFDLLPTCMLLLFVLLISGIHERDKIINLTMACYSLSFPVRTLFPASIPVSRIHCIYSESRKSESTTTVTELSPVCYESKRKRSRDGEIERERERDKTYPLFIRIHVSFSSFIMFIIIIIIGDGRDRDGCRSFTN